MKLPRRDFQSARTRAVRCGANLILQISEAHTYKFEIQTQLTEPFLGVAKPRKFAMVVRQLILSPLLGLSLVFRLEALGPRLGEDIQPWEGGDGPCPVVSWPWSC